MEQRVSVMEESIKGLSELSQNLKHLSALFTPTFTQDLRDVTDFMKQVKEAQERDAKLQELEEREEEEEQAENDNLSVNSATLNVPTSNNSSTENLVTSASATTANSSATTAQASLSLNTIGTTAVTASPALASNSVQANMSTVATSVPVSSSAASDSSTVSVCSTPLTTSTVSSVSTTAGLGSSSASSHLPAPDGSTSVTLNPIETIFAAETEKLIKDKTVTVSPAINESISNFVNKAIGKFTDPEEYKLLTEKYLTPSNTPHLVTPKINPEMLRLMTKEQSKFKQLKDEDAGLCVKQEQLIKGLIPLVQAMDKNTNTEVAKLLMDSFKLLSQVNMNFNQKRKEKILPALGKAKHLAYRNNPVTTQLFGDDIEGEFKKVETTSKLVEAMKAPAAKRQLPHHLQQSTSGTQKRAKMDSAFLKNQMRNFYSARPKDRPPPNKYRNNQQSPQRQSHQQQQQQQRKHLGRGKRSY